MKFFCYFCFILFAFSCSSNNTDTTLNGKENSIPPSNAFTQKNTVNSGVIVTYKIISSLHNTFGYDIFIDGKIFIHQPNIPAAVGNQGFKNKEDAKKVAKLVVHKITYGEMPPKVSFEEIEKLTLIH